MAKENETVADIIAEMRRDANADEYTPDGILGQKLNYIADRLDAAHKREHGDFAKLLKTVDLRFDICQDIELVLKIGRDYQNKDGYRGAHYDTVKLLCDTIEYLRDKLPKPDSDWKAICAKCKDGDIEPKHCKYYGEPNGCNSPIYGEHPTAEKSSAVGDAAKLRDAAVTVYDVLKKLRPFALLLSDVGRKREFSHLVCLAKNRLDSALYAPARNCDAIPAEEMRKMFREELPIQLKNATEHEKKIIQLTADGIFDTVFAPYQPPKESEAAK